MLSKAFHSLHINKVSQKKPDKTSPCQQNIALYVQLLLLPRIQSLYATLIPVDEMKVIRVYFLPITTLIFLKIILQYGIL